MAEYDQNTENKNVFFSLQLHKINKVVTSASSVRDMVVVIATGCPTSPDSLHKSLVLRVTDT